MVVFVFFFIVIARLFIVIARLTTIARLIFDRPFIARLTTIARRRQRRCRRRHCRPTASAAAGQS
ncbi:hypothetical protein CYA_1868 [Synechococcus sp. JA-3-3Ab]|nr:hypothetical protein CYA_1868 [Synechococcus sp. JA-3-3Ab]